MKTAVIYGFMALKLLQFSIPIPLNKKPLFKNISRTHFSSFEVFSSLYLALREAKMAREPQFGHVWYKVFANNSLVIHFKV